MSEYDNTNTASLWPNDKTGRSDSFPDEGGSLNLNGYEFYVSAWKNVSAKGNAYRSLKLKFKTAAEGDPEYTGRLFLHTPAEGASHNHEGFIELENEQKVALEGWDKTTSDGREMISLRLVPYVARSSAPKPKPAINVSLKPPASTKATPAPQMPGAEDFDDDCPF